MSFIRLKMAIGGCLLLVLGFLVGSVFPQKYLPWSVETDIPQQYSRTDMMSTSTQTQDMETQTEDRALDVGEGSVSGSGLNPKENFRLLNTACSVLRAIQSRDYAALSGFIDAERGVTITPYSTVDTDKDLNFTPIQVKNFAKDQTRYTWGRMPGRGELIQLTVEEFMSGYLFGSDYTQAPRIGVDRVNIRGNALENVEEAYPGCRFVDFTFPGSGKNSAGQDWSSLKLVFAPGEQNWSLVGLIHSQWTA